jgi:hypothetical protein
MGLSNQLLLTLAVINTFAGCMSLLVIFTEGYSPTEIVTSVGFLILGMIFLADYDGRLNN